MRYRIVMSNGSHVDVADLPDFKREGTLVQIVQIKNGRAYLNKNHIVTIYEVDEESKEDKLMTSTEWEKKVREMEDEKSQKKFADYNPFK